MHVPVGNEGLPPYVSAGTCTYSPHLSLWDKKGKERGMTLFDVFTQVNHPSLVIVLYIHISKNSQHNAKRYKLLMLPLPPPNFLHTLCFVPC